MEDKKPLSEIDLESRKLKISEFILALLIGIVVSTFIEAVFSLFSNKTAGFYWWVMYSSWGGFALLFFWYKRIIGFPDFVEYSYEFVRNSKFSWKDYSSLFTNVTNENLKKYRYIGLKLFHYLWWGKTLIKTIGYARSEITRTRWGTKRAYIYQYFKPTEVRARLVFLIGISHFGHDSGIIMALKDTIEDLKKKGVIIEKKKFSEPQYFHKSLLYPFFKKAKKKNINRLI